MAPLQVPPGTHALDFFPGQAGPTPKPTSAPAASATTPALEAGLRAAGVRAVALIGGERGSQVAGQRRTVEKLRKQGYPAKLWVMKDAGHHYSADIDTIMAEAMDFVLAAPLAGGERSAE